MHWVDAPPGRTTGQQRLDAVLSHELRGLLLTNPQCLAAIIVRGKRVAVGRRGVRMPHVVHDRDRHERHQARIDQEVDHFAAYSRFSSQSRARLVCSSKNMLGCDRRGEHPRQMRIGELADRLVGRADLQPAREAMRGAAQGFLGTGAVHPCVVAVPVIHRQPRAVLQHDRADLVEVRNRPVLGGGLDGEIGTREVGTREVGAREVGTREVGTREVGTREVGTREVGTREVGTREVGAREVGTREVGTREVGTREVGTREVGTREVGTAR
jgi:hypothetical protein